MKAERLASDGLFVDSRTSREHPRRRASRERLFGVSKFETMAFRSSEFSTNLRFNGGAPDERPFTPRTFRKAHVQTRGRVGRTTPSRGRPVRLSIPLPINLRRPCCAPIHRSASYCASPVARGRRPPLHILRSQRPRAGNAVAAVTGRRSPSCPAHPDRPCRHRPRRTASFARGR